MTESRHQPPTDQLEDALAQISHPEARYHLRECLQLLEQETPRIERKA